MGHYGKREAEADAKPYYYSGLHYPTVYGGAYTYGYPYAGVYGHHYGKREAEADAKPYYYSGLHYPTVYSGAYSCGYPYAGVYGHHYGKRPYSYGYGRFGYYG